MLAIAVVKFSHCAFLHVLTITSQHVHQWELGKDGGVLIRSSVLGCVCVQNIDPQRRRLSILAPAPHPIPG